ncbi:MAG: hypothetical protein IKS16_04375 [Lachnospiraceae bacterium]|nr:hypothetical protein [Lachnospiraceae bacterium]
MTKLQRVRDILLGIIMIAVAGVLFFFRENVYWVIISVLSIIYTFRGLSTIIYYFSMARFMNGGRAILYKGVIMLDFGILTGTLTDVPRIYVLLYLVAIHAFSGAVELLRAREAASYGGAWKLKMFHGILDLGMAFMCIVFIGQLNIAVIIYASGLVYSAILRIVSACRRTKLIYIP